MKILKCESCGGNIEASSNAEFATCPYCHTKYKLNETKDFYIRMDDNVRDTIKDVGKATKFLSIPVIIISLCVLAVIVIIAISIISHISDSKNTANNILNNANRVANEITNNSNNEEFKNDVEEFKQEFKKELDNLNSSSVDTKKAMFNNSFVIYEGNKNDFFVATMLDNVILSNSKNQDKIITIEYEGKKTSNKEEIVSIKKSLKKQNYTVELGYDENGYVNKITIK